MSATPVVPATPPDAEPAVDAITQVGLSFKAAMGSVRRLRGRETQRDDLSYAQYQLLFGLAAEQQLPASRLAGLADLSPATVTQMLDHLEHDGLVHRERSVLDKRVVLVSLTERGVELVAQRRELLERRWREALAQFDDGQLLSAAAVLDQLHELFDSYAAGH